jgi:hypothetical protein
MRGMIQNGLLNSVTVLVECYTSFYFHCIEKHIDRWKNVTYARYGGSK